MEYEQFWQMVPNCQEPEEWFSVIGDHLSEFGIETPEQIAMFFAQLGHESLDFNVIEENLNYSSQRLSVVFPKYFRTRNPSDYHRKPEAIANVVYGGRMGNGPESTGDGWKYRGRGLIMITGKNNYSACSKYLYSDENILLDRPELLSENKEVALLSALWFWQKNDLQNVSDIRQSTRIINGGFNGLDDRIERYERALSILV